MKVLVAEDEAISRRLLQNYLEKWGHEVTLTENGVEAWERFQEADYPLVISDWTMPEMDGLELIRRIRSSDRSGYVYVILLTARAQKEDVVEGMDVGADDFVSKPFDRDELRVRLREGERIIRLEQTLAEQNRALRDAQAALAETEKRATLGQAAPGGGDAAGSVAAAVDAVTALRGDVLAMVPPDARDSVSERFDQCLSRLERLADTPTTLP